MQFSRGGAAHDPKQQVVEADGLQLLQRPSRLSGGYEAIGLVQMTMTPCWVSWRTSSCRRKVILVLLTPIFKDERLRHGRDQALRFSSAGADLASHVDQPAD